MHERNALFRELTTLGVYKEAEAFVESPILCNHAPDPLPRPTLRYLSMGNHVMYLQRRLNCHKVKYQAKWLSAESAYGNTQVLAPLKVDGKFGSKTRQAVIAFQEGRFLEKDGIVGPITWGKLNEYNRTILKSRDATKRVFIPCPGAAKRVATSKNYIQIANSVESRFSLSYLKNVGTCWLAIGAWDREGEIYKNKKLLHWFWLAPGDEKYSYKPPDGTMEVTASCELECSGSGILEIPLAVS